MFRGDLFVSTAEIHTLSLCVPAYSCLYKFFFIIIDLTIWISLKRLKMVCSTIIMLLKSIR